MRKGYRRKNPLPFRKTHIEYVPSGKYHTKMKIVIEDSAEKGMNRQNHRKAQFTKIK